MPGPSAKSNRKKVGGALGRLAKHVGGGLKDAGEDLTEGALSRAARVFGGKSTKEAEDGARVLTGRKPKKPRIKY